MLGYFRQQRKCHGLPAVWWPVAAPYGALLTAFVMFLIISPRWMRIGGLPISLAASSDQLAQPLAVLRLRAGRTAGLSRCHISESHMPGNTIPICTQREFGVIPGRPLPKQMRYLQAKWHIVDDDTELDFSITSHSKAIWRDKLRREGTQDGSGQTLPTDTRPKLLLVDEYRSALNWPGIRAALLEAKEAGVQSDVVLIEAEDDTPVEAIVGGVDLCRGLDLKPILKLQ